MKSRTLYYPRISFCDPNWVKSLALIYDSIYRIVPNGIFPDDAAELQPLLEDGSVGKIINPSPYVEDASDKFMAKIDTWSAAALGSSEAVENFARIHEDKIDISIKRLFEDLGLERNGKWYDVPTQFGENYMLYLARDIAIKNRLSLATEEWGPWTATNYYNTDGMVDDLVSLSGFEQQDDGEQIVLFNGLISGLCPINISEIPAKKIVEFRCKRIDEIRAMRESVSELYKSLQDIQEEDIVGDMIKDKIKDFETAMQDYRNSADIIKAKGWFGVKMMGFSAPVALGKVFSIPSMSIAILSAVGFAVGALVDLYGTRKDLTELRKNSPESYLVHLTKDFSHYTSARGVGDITFKAWNCFEEYIND